LVDSVLTAQQRFRDYRAARITTMQQYAETAACRRAFLLDYFGQTAHADTCGACDNCRTGRSQETARAESVAQESDLPFPVGADVEHQKFGRGQVQRYEGQNVVVLFEQVGSKSLVAEYA